MKKVNKMARRTVRRSPGLLALLVFFLLFSAGSAGLFAQEKAAPAKFALVIGNGAYTSLSPLANPVNDANDISAVLEHLVSGSGTANSTVFDDWSTSVWNIPGGNLSTTLTELPTLRNMPGRLQDPLLP